MFQVFGDWPCQCLGCISFEQGGVNWLAKTKIEMLVWSTAIGIHYQWSITVMFEKNMDAWLQVQNISSAALIIASRQDTTKQVITHFIQCWKSNFVFFSHCLCQIFVCVKWSTRFVICNLKFVLLSLWFEVFCLSSSAWW